MVGLAGVLLGDALMFLVGRYFGMRSLRIPSVAALLTPRRYAQVQAKFDRYGNRLMFVARFLPGMRIAVFFSAGMTQWVTFVQFLMFDGFAALLTVPLWVWLGYYGAENREWLLAWIKHGQGGVAVLSGIIVSATCRLIWRRGHKRRSRLLEYRALRSARPANTSSSADK